jgi:hypothetical protein
LSHCSRTSNVERELDIEDSNDIITCRLISRANNKSITRNVQLIKQEKEVFLQIEKWSSLHDFLLIEKRQNVNILPLGKLTEAQIQRLLNTHDSLTHETIVAGPVQYNSCFIPGT